MPLTPVVSFRLDASPPSPHTQVEFIRPKHVAENYVNAASDAETGFLTAVVFKVSPSLSTRWGKRKLRHPHVPGV